MIKKLFNKKNFFLFTTGFIAIFVGIVGGVVDITPYGTNIIIGTNTGMSFFAGPRDDPFFFNYEQFIFIKINQLSRSRCLIFVKLLKPKQNFYHLLQYL